MEFQSAFNVLKDFLFLIMSACHVEEDVSLVKAKTSKFVLSVLMAYSLTKIHNVSYALRSVKRVPKIKSASFISLERLSLKVLWWTVSQVVKAVP